MPQLLQSFRIAGTQTNMKLGEKYILKYSLEIEIFPRIYYSPHRLNRLNLRVEQRENLPVVIFTLKY